MYQSECAPKSIRGAIVGAYQWMITSESSALDCDGGHFAVRTKLMNLLLPQSVSSSLPSSSTPRRTATTRVRGPSPSVSSSPGPSSSPAVSLASRNRPVTSSPPARTRLRSAPSPVSCSLRPTRTLSLSSTPRLPRRCTTSGRSAPPATSTASARPTATVSVPSPESPSRLCSSSPVSTLSSVSRTSFPQASAYCNEIS